MRREVYLAYNSGGCMVLTAWCWPSGPIPTWWISRKGNDWVQKELHGQTGRQEGGASSPFHSILVRPNSLQQISINPFPRSVIRPYLLKVHIFQYYCIGNQTLGPFRDKPYSTHSKPPSSSPQPCKRTPNIINDNYPLSLYLPGC